MYRAIAAILLSAAFATAQDGKKEEGDQPGSEKPSIRNLGNGKFEVGMEQCTCSLCMQERLAAQLVVAEAIGVLLQKEVPHFNILRGLYAITAKFEGFANLPEEAMEEARVLEALGLLEDAVLQGRTLYLVTAAADGDLAFIGNNVDSGSLRSCAVH